MFFDVYTNLCRHVSAYRASITALLEDRETIEEEIKIFYQKNDISGIMLFLRNLDGESGTSGTMSGEFNSGSAITMENKMRLHAPQPVEKLLPLLENIPDPLSIKSDLKELITKSYNLQPDFDLKNM